MSKSFIKIVDASILPASLMILSKAIGIFVLTKILDIPISLTQYSDNLFSIGGQSLSLTDVKFITSYSDLIMYTVLAIIFSLNIFRAIYLHNSHIKPTLVTKLADNNLLNLIKDSYEIYHSATAWLGFTVLANAVILVNVINGVTYLWVGILTVIISALLTVLLLQDVHKEIENIKKHPGQYNWS